MEIEIRHQSKEVMAWLTRQDQQDPTVQARLKRLCEDCKARKYTVAVLRSGEQDLLRQTSDLLRYNRRSCAQLTGRGR